MALKLLVVDDHEVVRRGISDLLGNSEVQVVAIVATGDEVLAEIAKNSPDVVLLDVRMEGTDGLVTLDTLRQEHPDLPVVMFSSYDNPTYIARSVALGASDYVLKGDSREYILGSLRRAVENRGPSSGSALNRIRLAMDSNTAASGAETDLPLTNRELQVLRHIALGLSNKEIAQSLTISVETVKEHVQNILRKLNATDRTDAAVRAVRMGMA